MYTDGAQMYQESNILSTPHIFYVPVTQTTTFSLTGVVDAGACGGALSISTQVSGVTTLTVLPALSLGTALTQPDCLNPLGTIQAAATGGGGGPYEYSIDGFATFNITGTFQLTVGAYFVEVRDAAGCGDGTNVTLNLTPATPVITGLTNISATTALRRSVERCPRSATSRTISHRAIATMSACSV